MPRRCRTLVGVRHPLLLIVALLDAAMPVPIVLLTAALPEALLVSPVVARDAVLLSVVLLDVVVPTSGGPPEGQALGEPCGTATRRGSTVASEHFLTTPPCGDPRAGRTTAEPCDAAAGLGGAAAPGQGPPCSPAARRAWASSQTCSAKRAIPRRAQREGHAPRRG